MVSYIGCISKKEVIILMEHEISYLNINNIVNFMISKL
jgi:hypothetical protein